MTMLRHRPENTVHFRFPRLQRVHSHPSAALGSLQQGGLSVVTCHTRRQTFTKTILKPSDMRTDAEVVGKLPDDVNKNCDPVLDPRVHSGRLVLPDEFKIDVYRSTKNIRPEVVSWKRK